MFVEQCFFSNSFSFSREHKQKKQKKNKNNQYVEEVGTNILSE